MRAPPRSFTRIAVVVAVLAPLCVANTMDAQYFGRNKVNYDRFDFRVFPSEHFELYYYPSESLATFDAARMAERWYRRHGDLLSASFPKNPLIFYADPPDFQQSNVIEGFIGQGTGGVTEGARDRVIMPFTGVYAETDHVLGHELVHVFQYRIAQAARGGLNNISNIPLWLIEGMAEYLSLGRIDANTAMWLRDALRRDDLPTITQLTRDPRYFPYRYGQALWAYIGGRWGDPMVNKVFRASIERGWENALVSQLGMKSDSLSKVWHAAIRAEYTPVLAGRVAPNDAGRGIVTARTTGDQNVSPAVSPDGRQVAFFSTRSLFGIDLFLADVATGDIIRQLTSVTNDAHFEALSFISSAGSWSPDGRKLAIVVYAEGNNEIDIVDAGNGNVDRRIKIPGIGAINDPAWSPDGGRIAFSGIRGGISDLYLFDLASGQTTQLTNDREAQLQPNWSPDGRVLAFATDTDDRTDFRTLAYAPMRLALMDVTTRQIRLLPRIGEGKHINPQFAGNGLTLFFVANPDGVSDIYRMTLTSGAVTRLTQVATGVSGITALSPALSVARGTGDVLFSIFDKGGFSIRALGPAARLGAPVAALPLASGVATALPVAGILPPAAAVATSVVELSLRDPISGLPRVVAEAPPRPASTALSVDYVGGPSIGVGFGGGFGTSLGGGIALSFSDILGNRIVNAVVQAQGDIKDLGGQALFLNRSRRLAWGVDAYHIPLAGAFASFANTTFDIGGEEVPGTIITEEIQRVFYDNAQFVMQYPFSMTRRLEFSAGFQRVSFSTEVDSLFIVADQVIDQVRVDLPTAPGLNFATGSAAFVGDYSFFGFTSPVAGGRYRFEASPYFGSLNYQTLLADYRRYFFMRPLTFAIRGLHYGRYGGDSESNRLQSLYVGQPTLIRGYDAGNFEASECTSRPGADDDCPQFSRLNGSRIAVANVELRIPLFGTEQFGVFNVPFLPLEIAPFVDAAAAWTSNDAVDWRFDRDTPDRVPVFSAGVSARINLFGYAVGEVYWVRPFQRPGRGSYFGFQLAPGW